ncbi:MAG: hypothetical protein COA78_06270 [Blastopirellula sp.]|nr:MAG: hypothetical protein COA78_06270 [Blastopirellula sp.]
MNQANPKVSRRDWFRLKIPHQNQSLGVDEPTANVSKQLEPIEHPPNHDGLDLNELPPMREALLSEDQLAMLFGDIEKLATEVQLMQRNSRTSGPNDRAKMDQSSSLSSAKDALLQNKTKRLQIRYRWNDTLWIDTLERKDLGFRLVRISHAGM